MSSAILIPNPLAVQPHSYDIHTRLPRSFSETDHDCDDGGIVANNPENPEAASMEVTDTRLINLPEKTKFDISSEYEFDRLEGDSNAGQFLNEFAITVIYPDITSLLGPDGEWDQSKDSAIRFRQNGVLYDSVEGIPNIPPLKKTDLKKSVGQYIKAKWIPFLESLGSGEKKVTVFQLDPNQLLTVSSGYKVVLRRPLSSSSL